MTFDEQLCAFELGLLKEEDLPSMAAAALIEGRDAHALAALAGETAQSNVFQLRSLFKRAKRELDLPVHELEDCRRTLLEFWLQEISEGRRSSLESLGEFVRNVFPILQTGQSRRYVGDADSLQSLIGIYWSFHDIADQRALSVIEMADLSRHAQTEAAAILRSRA